MHYLYLVNLFNNLFTLFDAHAHKTNNTTARQLCGALKCKTNMNYQ